MNTFVLVLIIHAYSTGFSTTTIPGYPSLEACQAAGQAWKVSSGSYQCIPGPRP